MRLAWLALLLVPTVAAQPGIVVEPQQAEPGQQISFHVTFPAHTQGQAELHYGDGRSQSVSSSAEELEILATAPEQRGSYTARLVVQTTQGEQMYEATYRVGQNQDAPLGAFSLVTALLCSALLARWRA